MLNKTYNVPGANVAFVVLENVFKIEADIIVFYSELHHLYIVMDIYFVLLDGSEFFYSALYISVPCIFYSELRHLYIVMDMYFVLLDGRLYIMCKDTKNTENMNPVYF
jgi:hypothetical protein